MKLQSMKDFVLEVKEKIDSEEIFESVGTYWIFKHAEFLNKPLELWMFIPCVDGVPIEYYDMKKTGGKYCSVGSNVEKIAKSRVLFEGFKKVICNGEIAVHKEGKPSICLSEMKDMTIEDLTRYDITLTETAKREIL